MSKNTGISRRALVLAGAAAVTAVPLIKNAHAQPVSAAGTPEEALNKLLEGNARYVANQPRERDFSATRASRVLGQAPFAAILGCADSRISPELAFDQPPGNMFVVRVAGNFVNDYGLGSLEFAASVLGTKLIMVLGHSSCGAVNAAVAAIQTDNVLPGHIADFVRSVKPGVETAVREAGPDLEQRAVIANVRHNVEVLKQAKPILADMVAKNAIRVVGCVYDLATGKVAIV